MNILLYRIRILLVVVPAIISIHVVEAGAYASVYDIYPTCSSHHKN